MQQNQKNSTDKYSEQPSQLLPFDTHPDNDDTTVTLPMNLIDYLTLGQAILDDKKEAIPSQSCNNSPLMKVNG